MEEKKRQLIVLLEEAMLKIQEAQYAATEIDEANELDFEKTDLDDVVDSLQAICNKAEGIE